MQRPVYFFSLALVFSASFIASCSADRAADQTVVDGCDILSAKMELPPITAAQKQEATELMRGLTILLGAADQANGNLSRDYTTLPETIPLQKVFERASQAGECEISNYEERLSEAEVRYIARKGPGCPANVEINRRLAAHPEFNAFTGHSSLQVNQDFEYLGIKSAHAKTTAFAPKEGRILYRSESEGSLVRTNGDEVRITSRFVACRATASQPAREAHRVRMDFPSFSTEFVTYEEALFGNGAYSAYGESLNSEEAYVSLYPERTGGYPFRAFFSSVGRLPLESDNTFGDLDSPALSEPRPFPLLRSAPLHLTPSPNL